MDLINKYLDLAEAWPGTPEWKKKHDPSYNPYDPEGKMKKALKLQPYGYRDKASSSDEDETPTQQPAMKKRGRPKKMSEAMSAYGRIDSRFKKLSGRSMGAAAKEYGDEAKRLQKEIDAQKAENERRQAAMKKEEVEEIEELSKATLASYAKKSSNDARISGQIAKDFENKSSSSRKPGMKAGAARLAGEYKKRAWKREDGTMKAIDRLAKEEVVQKYLKVEQKDDLPFKADKPKQVATPGKYGAGYSTAKHLAQMGLRAAMKDLKKGPEKGKRQVS